MATRWNSSGDLDSHSDSLMFGTYETYLVQGSDAKMLERASFGHFGAYIPNPYRLYN